MRKKKSNKKNNNGITTIQHSPSESQKKKSNQLTDSNDVVTTITSSNNDDINAPITIAPAIISTHDEIINNNNNNNNNNGDENLENLSKIQAVPEENTTTELNKLEKKTSADETSENTSSERSSSSSSSEMKSSGDEKKLQKSKIVANSSSSKINSSGNNSARKISELMTVTLPLQQLQPQKAVQPASKPPLQRSYYNNQDRVEKCRSMLVPSLNSSTIKNSQIDGTRVIFKSNSLRALVRIPSLKEMEQIKKENRPPVFSNIVQAAKKNRSQIPVAVKNKPITQSDTNIHQILIDLMNLQKLQERQQKKKLTAEAMSNSLKRSETSPMPPRIVEPPTVKDRNKLINHVTVKTTGPSNNMSSSSSKLNYKKVLPTQTNTKKLVVQVLRDLIQLYKSDMPNNNTNKKPPPATSARHTPVEIKIRKQDDKLII